MIARIMMLVPLVLAVSLVGPRPTRAQDEMERLQKSFQERYRTLLRLKDQGKVGETSKGLAEAVEPGYLAERVEPKKPESQTLRAFLGAENADRRKLYGLIARKTNTRPEIVALRNARRVFDKAAPEHYLKLSNGQWIKKKDFDRRRDSDRRGRGGRDGR